MATTVPPPNKKRRTELAELAKEQRIAYRIPDDAGSVRVQFRDQESGSEVGPSILVPLQESSIQNLERIYHALSKEVSLWELFSFSNF